LSCWSLSIRGDDPYHWEPVEIAFHPLVAPSLLKERIGFIQYRGMLTYPNWNRAIALVRKARAWDNAVAGARRLLDLNEKFRPRLARRQYLRHQIQIYLFLLDTLRRARRWREHAALWHELEGCPELTLRYRAGCGAARSKYVTARHRSGVEVHLLWLCRREIEP
jgi:hypothetical protein